SSTTKPTTKHAELHDFQRLDRLVPFIDNDCTIRREIRRLEHVIDPLLNRRATTCATNTASGRSRCPREGVGQPVKHRTPKGGRATLNVPGHGASLWQVRVSIGDKMAIDVAAARSVTPGVQFSAFLNSAGSSLPTTAVLARVKSHLDLEARVGGYDAIDVVGEEHELVYSSVADLIGASKDEIALTESATRSWTAAFGSMRFQPGDRILTSSQEYASNVIAFLQAKQRYGVVIEKIPNDPLGQVDVDALAEMLDERVKLIAVVHVPSQNGLINPVERIGGLAQSANVTYLVDACQSVGQIPVDVRAIGCDLLSATGRKFLRAPRGTGFLYAKRAYYETAEPLYLDLFGAQWTDEEVYEIRADARRFELWESSLALRLGLGLAVRQAMELGIADISERTLGLAATLRSLLANNVGVEVLDTGRQQSGIVRFRMDGVASSDVKGRLSARNVAVASAGTATSRYDLAPRGIEDFVRASPHYFNTKDELVRLVEAL
ncbi:MAG: aminotransferase class V-fold PLP-dependent enzyme, partial [Acidimicrobiales bacterium]